MGRDVFGESEDLYENDNAIVVNAESPALKKDDIPVEVEDEDLVIRGERRRN